MIRRVYIEITNICNLACGFCQKNTRTPQYMSVREFEYILTQIKDICSYIYLHVQGEPLLHPDLNEMLEIAGERGFQVQLVTNGTLLKDHTDLIEYPALRKLSVSLQSVEYHTADIEAYMDPIFSLIEKASAQGRPYCELRFWRDDQMDQPRTEKCLSMIHSRYTVSDSGREKNEKILPGVYVDYSNPFEWPSVSASDSTKGTCLGGIMQVAVLVDGTVVPCCLDENGSIALGNIFETDIHTILKSERYLNLVEGFRRHELTENLCRKCTFRSRFD